MNVTYKDSHKWTSNDLRALGPGVYDVEKSSKVIALTPKSTVKWENSKSHRFTPMPESKIGPGSYNLFMDKNNLNPSFARQNYLSRSTDFFSARKMVRNTGSIRDNFEE